MRESGKMKKRYLPPSPLKIGHTNPKGKRTGQSDKAEQQQTGVARRKLSGWFYVILLFIVILVGVVVYIQKFSNFCWVWQEYYYTSLKNETHCMYITNHIQKGKLLSTAGFRYKASPHCYA